MSDRRPTNCRFRLKEEGKGYPRSSCQGCGKGIMTGLGKSCSYTQQEPPITRADLDAAVALALEGAASTAANACLVEPDGGSPTEEERLVCELAYHRIRALIQPHQADALARMRQEAHNAAREVKPLVWDARADIPGLHNADSAIGWWYNVRELHHGGFEYEGDPVFAFRAVPQWFDTLEDAKAAAQADYTARVLAALALPVDGGAKE